MPFIKAETAKYLGHYASESDDEVSIAMIAFHEAILNYDSDKGNFMHYASMLIRSRLIDHDRKEVRHKANISLDEDGDDNDPLINTIADPSDKVDTNMRLEATKEEIAELAKVLNDFGVSFKDLSDHSPKQERTMDMIKKVIQRAKADTTILDELLETKKLPLKRLVNDGGERKTIERHRKYVLGMLVILTNGYEIIRGHLWHVLKGEAV